MKRYIRRWVILSLIVCVLCTFGAAATEDAVPFAGGDGTEESPYLIETAEQLNEIRNYTDSKTYYKLIADITFSKEDFEEGGMFYNGGTGWDPIDPTSIYGAICLDGDGHTIKGLYSAGHYAAGLFGSLAGGSSVYDLNMVDTDITGKKYAGSIVADITKRSIKIYNCTNEGEVKVVSTVTILPRPDAVYAGGIIGRICDDYEDISHAVSIGNCHNSGTVSAFGAYAHAGGIAGYSGVVKNSSNTAAVSASTTYYYAYAGGIAGEISGYATNCSNSGNVWALSDTKNASSEVYAPSPSAFAGGIVGYTEEYGGANKCYNSGEVLAEAQGDRAFMDVGYCRGQAYAYGGGIVGYIKKSGGVRNSFNVGRIASKAFTRRSSACDSYNTARSSGILGSGSKYEVTNCYNIGALSAESNGNTYLNAYGGTPINCYCLDLTAENLSGIATYTAGQLASQETFTDFDFESIWTMDGAENYPFPELREVEMVYEPTALKLNVESWPDKTNYSVGDSVDLTGLEVSVVYAHGEISILNHSELELSYDFSNPGDTEVTAFFGDLSFSYEVCVSSPEFSGGCGSEAHPFLITRKEELDAVRSYPDCSFELMADIIFTDSDFARDGDFWGDGAGFAPLSSVYGHFTGVFDGNGHVISGLCQDVTATDYGYAGLFGRAKYAEIVNLGVVDADITIRVTSEYDRSYAYAGGIVGYVPETHSDEDKTYIGGCWFSGTIRSVVGRGTEENLGGIVGYADNITIEDCSNSGSLLGDGNTGGIVGYAECMDIRRCCNTGALTGDDVGGIVGSANLDGLIEDCFNSGRLSGGNLGGIIGFSFMTISIRACYNVGTCPSEDTMGGIAGYASDRESIYNCYYLDTAAKGIDRAASAEEDLSIKCTAQEMMSEDTFVALDFGTTWTMAGRSDYPYPELTGVSMETASMAASKTEDGIQVVLSLSGSVKTDDVYLMVVSYDESGRMVDMTLCTAEALDAVLDGGTEIATPSAHSYGVFLTDRQLYPLCDETKLD